MNRGTGPTFQTSTGSVEHNSMLKEACRRGWWLWGLERALAYRSQAYRLEPGLGICREEMDKESEEDMLRHL